MAKQILGRVSIILKGEYNSTTNYQKLDIVSYNGSSYACLQDCVGVLPTDTNYWQLVAEKGEQGLQGEKGEQGERGLQGEQGIQGITGEKGEQGIQGERGLQGETGATPNIQIGTVETLEPTEQATVTQTGTTENPIFNFAIPKGKEGQGANLEELGIIWVDLGNSFMGGKHTIKIGTELWNKIQKGLFESSRNEKSQIIILSYGSSTKSVCIGNWNTMYKNYDFIGTYTNGLNGQFTDLYTFNVYPSIEYGGTDDRDIVINKKEINFVPLTNTTLYSITNDAMPVYKKYVDDTVNNAIGNINTILASLTTLTEEVE